MFNVKVTKEFNWTFFIGHWTFYILVFLPTRLLIPFVSTILFYLAQPWNRFTF